MLFLPFTASFGQGVFISWAIKICDIGSFNFRGAVHFGFLNLEILY